MLDGSKNFEIWQNDRGYQKGDTVLFEAVELHTMAELERMVAV